MSKHFDYEKYIKTIENEYINNYEFISSMKEDEKGIFIRNMKRLCGKFKISILTYLRMLEFDKYGCAICKKSYNEISGRMCLDHNHDLVDEYGYELLRPRGFLCTKCNFLLGNVQDNIKVLKKAIVFLESRSSYFIKYKSYETGGYISSQDYKKLFSEQEGNCKICGVNQTKINKKLSVDHNHKTGEVRGLLCSNCNSLLGQCGDSADILKNAILYLKRNLGEKIYYSIEVAIIRGEPLPEEFAKYENILGTEWVKRYYEYTTKNKNL